jgi:hypothetical protein
MSQVIDFEKSRLLLAAKRGFRNWNGRFSEHFGLDTTIESVSMGVLSFLAQGKEKGTFYLYDLIMSMKDFGSGFEFNEIHPRDKMLVIDHYLFLLDRIRFECMKRLNWLENYPGETLTLVELVIQFEKRGRFLQAKIPQLSKEHPAYEEFSALNPYDREGFIRKMIPDLLGEIKRFSDSV